VAGIAVYATGTSSPSSSSAVPASVTVTAIPPAPLIAPGQTQNYSMIQVLVAGPELNGTLKVSVFAPEGLSLILNQSSLSLSESPQAIPVVLKADRGLPPGNYQVTVETSSRTIPANNHTFTVDVVPMLVVMQDLAFHPQNITVSSGTPVTWMNLDSTIGCCDPGNHDVSFQSGANATSPILTRLETWSYTFEAAGVVEYDCTIHPFMKGQITVTG